MSVKIADAFTVFCCGCLSACSTVSGVQNTTNAFSNGEIGKGIGETALLPFRMVGDILNPIGNIDNYENNQARRKQYKADAEAAEQYARLKAEADGDPERFTLLCSGTFGMGIAGDESNSVPGEVNIMISPRTHTFAIDTSSSQIDGWPGVKIRDGLHGLTTDQDGRYVLYAREQGVQFNPIEGDFGVNNNILLSADFKSMSAFDWYHGVHDAETQLFHGSADCVRR